MKACKEKVKPQMGLAASAALGAISEDPSALGKSLIFVGLAEGGEKEVQHK